VEPFFRGAELTGESLLEEILHLLQSTADLFKTGREKLVFQCEHYIWREQPKGRCAALSGREILSFSLSFTVVIIVMIF
jgi:hypothetical protein